MAYLVEHGLPYGYLPEPDKSLYVCKGDDEAVAQAPFAWIGVNALSYVRGHRYSGS